MCTQTERSRVSPLWDMEVVKPSCCRELFSIKGQCVLGNKASPGRSLSGPDVLLGRCICKSAPCQSGDITANISL